MTMKTCPGCKSLVHEQAPVCPSCDLRLRPHNVLLYVGVGLVIAGIIAWSLLR